MLDRGSAAWEWVIGVESCGSTVEASVGMAELTPEGKTVSDYRGFPAHVARLHDGKVFVRGSETGRRGELAEVNAPGDAVRVGTNVVYAAIHNYGGTIKPKKAKYLKFMVGGQWASKKEVTIPQRQFLGIGDRQVDKINGVVDAWVEDLLGPAK